MFCAIWYYIYNLKNVKNTHGERYFSKVAGFKVALLHWCFYEFQRTANVVSSFYELFARTLLRNLISFTY